MPTYQYVCETCGESYEVVQKFTDSTLTIHDPGCGGPVRKKFNAVGVVFKGSGFYRNDSRDKSATSESAGATKTETKSDGGSSGGDTTATPAKSEPAKSEPAKTATPAPSSTPAPASSSSASSS